MAEIEPRAVATRMLRGWWLVAGLALIGGMLGYLAGLFTPRVYTAQVDYYIGIDISYWGGVTDPTGVAFAEIQRVIQEITLLADSDPVVSQVVAEAAAQGIPTSLDEFRTRSRIDRFYTSWVFSIRDSDPVRAATLVNLWVDAVDGSLLEAYQHGLTYDRLRQEDLLLGSCFRQGDLAAGNACAGTEFASVESYLEYHDDLIIRRDAEDVLRHAMVPAITVRKNADAVVPGAPSGDLPAVMVLAGAILGFLVGAVLVMRREP